MNKQEIVTVLYELHKISGFRISLHSVDYTEIAAYPERALPFCELVNRDLREHKLCTECDRRACLEAERRGSTYIYKCRFGLCEAVSPLYNFGVLSGFLMMGQISESGISATDAEQRMRRFIKKAHASADVLLEIPSVRSDMISSYVKIMTICAQYLTLSNFTETATPPREELAKKYINDNLSKKITLDDICRHIGCSRSTLLTSFRKSSGITVNDYIVSARLVRARQLLLEGRMTIGEIALEVGFSDQSYFSKVFVLKYGVTPSEYKHTRIKTDNASQDSDEKEGGFVIERKSGKEKR